MMKITEATLTPGERELQWAKPNPNYNFPWNLLRRPYFIYRERKNNKPVYTCSIKTLVTFHITPSDETVDIEQVSDEAIDASMRAAIRIRSSTMSWASGGAGKFDRGIGAVDISWSALPAGFAFEPFFRTNDGRLLPLRSQPSLGPWDPNPFCAGKGATGGRHINPSAVAAAVGIGDHTGMLVLRPNIDIAFYDPAIETIWDSTLEVPFSFTVHGLRSDWEGR